MQEFLKVPPNWVDEGTDIMESLPLGGGMLLLIPFPGRVASRCETNKQGYGKEACTRDNDETRWRLLDSMDGLLL